MLKALGASSLIANSTFSNVTINGIALAITTKSANYTATVTDDTILANTQAQNVTVTLLTAAAVTGKLLTIKKIDTSANSVIITTTSSQTIDGQSSYVVSTNYSGVNVQSDGSNWWIVANLNGRDGVSGTF